MWEVIATLVTGVIGYCLAKFILDPLFNVLALRKEIHIAILKYANNWGADSEWQKAACEEYRLLAARGIAENESLEVPIYLPFRYLLKRFGIHIGEAAKCLWIMDADAARPDKQLRDETVEKVYQYLSLSSGAEKK